MISLQSVCVPIQKRTLRVTVYTLIILIMYVGFLLKLLNVSQLMLVTLTHLFMTEFEVHANKIEQSTL